MDDWYIITDRANSSEYTASLGTHIMTNIFETSEVMANDLRNTCAAEITDFMDHAQFQKYANPTNLITILMAKVFST